MLATGCFGIAIHAVSGWPSGANSRGQFLGFTSGNPDGTHVTLWDPQTGVTDLGSSVYAYLNNAGQVAFCSFAGQGQSKIWDKGVVTNVTLPLLNPPISPNAIYTRINDAGQLAGPRNNSISPKYLLTPSGNGCAG